MFEVTKLDEHRFSVFDGLGCEFICKSKTEARRLVKFLTENNVDGRSDIDEIYKAFVKKYNYDEEEDD